MRGKGYSSFDAFRQDFWKMVAKDPVLSKEFTVKDLRDMRKGMSPTVNDTQTLGKLEKYQLHHSIPINRGGQVYNVDNINIMTPKFHKEVLAKKYHFGGK